MSRIGQMLEHKRMREQLDALEKRVTEHAIQVAELAALVASLRTQGNDIESRRGPGRPRKDSLGG
jgi:cell division septum initiation protein DivIVA